MTPRASADNCAAIAGSDTASIPAKIEKQTEFLYKIVPPEVRCGRLDLLPGSNTSLFPHAINSFQNR